MRKSILLLLPLFAAACSNDDKSPVITVDALYLRQQEATDGETEKVNYASRMDELPPLKVGDEVEAFLTLDGNGSELQTFTLQNDDEVATELHYKEAEVTTEGNLTDEEHGQLRFKDGVVHTDLSVEATVERVEANGDVYLTFYLSSKGECEGAQELIVLKTRQDSDDSTEE